LKESRYVRLADTTMFSVLKHARIPLFSNRKSNHIFTIWQHYSEYFIGHSGSTYWRKKDSEKAEIFLKIEPYLTFLNIHQLERQGADIQTKIDELEQTEPINERPR
jgi:hypothetical protein